MSAQLNGLSERDLALARRNTYALLSRLYLDGIVDDLRPYIDAIPDLKAALNSVPPADQAAAHYDLFGLLVQPYESFFLSADNLVGGSIADDVQGVYQQAQVQVALTASYGPDYIGAELHFMAALCAYEADAFTAGDQVGVSLARTRQRLFLDGHLLRWFLPLAIAVQQQNNIFFTEVTRLAEDLLTSHRDSLDDLMVVDAVNAPFTLPDIPGSFDDPKLDLDTIAEWLCTPAYSGLYLSRHDIGAMGRRLQLPVGFQSRAKQLHHLFTSAGEYGKEQAVIAELQTVFEDWQRRYDTLGSERMHAAVWSERVALMISNLKLMAAALSENAHPEVGN